MCLLFIASVKFECGREVVTFAVVAILGVVEGGIAMLSVAVGDGGTSRKAGGRECSVTLTVSMQRETTRLHNDVHSKVTCEEDKKHSGTHHRVQLSRLENCPMIFA
ncbi:hypothetical protein IQ07DRAFT_385210 [Pyrenochaeta sp. DS3sAY3a]|nr:hypothetical protein IQ07DRAFT_385210 [Pyrenochaeta sp. DS3sAY3a]